MRIATFNLENLGRRSQEPEGFAARVQILRPQLERLDADILCLQEIDAAKPGDGGPRRLIALERLLDGTDCCDFETVSTIHPSTGHPADRHNLAIVSRWPIRTHTQVLHRLVLPPIHTALTGDPPGGARALLWDRPVLYAAIETPGGLLHVVNLHLKAPSAAAIPGQKSGAHAWKNAGGWAEGFYVAAVKRAGQALEVRLLIDRLFDADPNARIVVAGDFNAEEREVPARIVSADIEDTGNGALAGRVMVPLEHSLPDSRRYSVIHLGRKVMLDHLYVSRPMLSGYRGLEIHNEALGDEMVAFAAVADSPESYHAPVVAAFDDG